MGKPGKVTLAFVELEEIFFLMVMVYLLVHAHFGDHRSFLLLCCGKRTCLFQRGLGSLCVVFRVLLLGLRLKVFRSFRGILLGKGILSYKTWLMIYCSWLRLSKKFEVHKCAVSVLFELSAGEILENFKNKV